MDALSLLLGNTIIGGCILYFIIWLISKSPVLYFSAKLIFIVIFGFGSPIVAGFVALLSISEGDFGLGLFKLFLGFIVGYPLARIFYPELKKLFKKENRNFKVWEKQ
jgi:hypothetical protein